MRVYTIMLLYGASDLDQRGLRTRQLCNDLRLGCRNDVPAHL